MSALAEKVEVLARSEALKLNQDPTGKRWIIKSQRGKSLLKVEVEPFSSATKVPAVFAGEWTSRHKLQTAIDEWLKVQWNKCDAKVAHTAKPLSHANTTKAEKKDSPATKRTPTEVAQDRVNKNAGSTDK